MGGACCLLNDRELGEKKIRGEGISKRKIE